MKAQLLQVKFYGIEIAAASGNIIRSTRGTSVFAAYQSNNSDVYLGTTSANTFKIITNDATAVTIGSDKNATFAGQVLCDTNTTSPAGGEAVFYKSSAGAVLSGFQAILETGSAGSRATALTLDNSQNATFTGNLSVMGSSKYVEVGSANTGTNFGFIGWNSASKYLFIGNSYNSAYNEDIKIDSSGNTTFGGSATIRKPSLGGSTPMADGTLVIGAGTTDYFSFRLDSGADLYFDKSYGGVAANIFSIDRSSTNGDITFAGNVSLEQDASSPVLLVKAVGQTSSTAPTASLILSPGSFSSNATAPRIIGYRTADFSSAAARSAGLKFGVAQNNVAKDAMYLTEAGNLGIGTDNVYGDLHLQGGQQDIILTNTNADGVAGQTISRIIGQARGYNNNGAVMQSIDFTTNATNWFKGDIVFKTNNTDGTDVSVAATERLRIDSSGTTTSTKDGSGLQRNLLLSNLNDTDGDATGIGFSMLNNGTFVKSGIYFKRTTTQGRGSLVFLNNNEVNGNNATLANQKMALTADGELKLGSTDGAAAQLHIENTAKNRKTLIQGNGNNQGFARNSIVVNHYPVVSSGSQLIIPFVQQGNLNSTTIIKLMGHSARFNSSDPLGFTATIQTGHLQGLYSTALLDSTGNISGISVSGMNLIVSFTTAYTNVTADGVFVTLEYMTNNLSYSINVGNIAMN